MFQLGGDANDFGRLRRSRRLAPCVLHPQRAWGVSSDRGNLTVRTVNAIPRYLHLQFGNALDQRVIRSFHANHEFSLYWGREV